MITFSKLGHYGRLGNQMFQYAALVGIATKYGYEFGYPPANETIRANTKYGETFELRKLFLGIRNFWPFNETSDWPQYVEPEGDFSAGFQLLDKCNDCINLLGYFQSERYFKHCESTIREMYQFSNMFYRLTADVIRYEMGMRMTYDPPMVSVHVRRGDYLQLSPVLPPLSLDYYQAAMSAFQEDTSFLVFSDDHAWCEENLPKIRKRENLHFVKGHSSAVDMCLMSRCDSHIIANSSFSWWGAWLNPDPEKIVIAPKNWFGPAGPKNHDGIYCDGWIRL